MAETVRQDSTMAYAALSRSPAMCFNNPYPNGGIVKTPACHRPPKPVHYTSLSRRKRTGERPMTLEELRLLRVVQGILVRNYVDTQKLDVQVIGSSVYIEGNFVIFDYQPSRKKEDHLEQDLGLKRTLLHIEQQIRGLGEVTYLEMKLKNWERRGMQWVAKHETY